MPHFVSIFNLPVHRWRVTGSESVLDVRGYDAAGGELVSLTLTRGLVAELVASGVIGIGDNGVELFDVERLLSEVTRR